MRHDEKNDSTFFEFRRLAPFSKNVKMCLIIKVVHHTEAPVEWVDETSDTTASLAIKFSDYVHSPALAFFSILSQFKHFVLSRA